IACSSISTRLAVAIAIAPPEPPSPRINATLGTPRLRQVSVERAMASARPRHAEIMLEPAFGRRALLVADHAYALAAKAAEAADNRRVLAELAVARERLEIGEQLGDIVEAMRALRMARH